MLHMGDVVCLLPGHEAELYHTFRDGITSGFVLKNRLGVVVEPDRDTPGGHYVIYYNYTMTYSLVTIPLRHLHFVRHGAI